MHQTSTYLCPVVCESPHGGSEVALKQAAERRDGRSESMMSIESQPRLCRHAQQHTSSRTHDSAAALAAACTAATGTAATHTNRRNTSRRPHPSSVATRTISFASLTSSGSSGYVSNLSISPGCGADLEIRLKCGQNPGRPPAHATASGELGPSGTERTQRGARPATYCSGAVPSTLPCMLSKHSTHSAPA